MKIKAHTDVGDVLDDEFADILRQKTPSERIRMATEANDTARAISAAGIRFQHPDWSEVQVQHEVARRMLNAAD